MKVLKNFPLIIILSCSAQDEILDQEYYAVSNNNVIEFKQNNSSILISYCTDLGQCNSPKTFIINISTDSTVHDNTKTYKVKNHNFGSMNTIIQNNELVVIDYPKGRKGIKDSFRFNGKEKVQYMVLYPKSELLSLKSISEISDKESKGILSEFTRFLKSEKGNSLLSQDLEYWTKFNDLVISKGYSPIGAEKLILIKTD